MLQDGQSLEESLLIPKDVKVQRNRSIFCCPFSASMTQLILISFAHFFVFTGYAGVQNLESSMDLKEVNGSVSIGIIYVFLGSSCLVAPMIIKVIGEKTAIVLQFIIITAFCGSNIFPKVYTMYPAAALLGLGAAPQWVSQGKYVTLLAENYKQYDTEGCRDVFGWFNGIFYGVYQMTQVSGNLISMLVLREEDVGPTQQPTNFLEPPKSEINEHTRILLFMTYIVSCATGVILMKCMVKPLTQLQLGSALIETKAIDDINEETSCSILTSTLRLMVKPRLFLLIPLMVVNGVEMGFAYSALTANVIKENLGEDNIGLGMICFGVVDTLSATIFGKISDIVGIPVCIFIGFVFQSLCGAWLWVCFDDLKPNSWLQILAACGVWGLGDGTCSALISALVGKRFPRDKEAAFANWQMFQAVGVAGVFFSHDYLSLRMMILVVGISWVAAIAGLFCFCCLTRQERCR